MAENILPNEDLIKMAEKEEPRLLSILLKDKDLLAAAIAFGLKPTEGGQPGHFLIPKNNFLYNMIYKNFIKYNSLLTRTAMESFIDVQTGLTEETKATYKISWDKISCMPDSSSEDYSLLVNNANDRYLAWQFYEMWKKGDSIVRSASGHAELVKKFMGEMNSINNLSPDPYSLTMSLSDGVKKAIEYIEDRRTNPDRRDAIKVGIATLDNIYNGFARGSYTVVSGMVNGGKTTLMMNIGFNMAKLGYNVVYVSLEKDASLFFRRILALHALTDYNRIKVGGTTQFGLSDYWYNKLKEAADDLEKIKPNYHCLQFVQNTTLTKILYDVDKLRNKQKVDVLIVDYLQVIGVETHTVGRYDIDLANVHKRLMAYGRTHNMVVFTALQLKNSSSKEIRKKADKVTNQNQLDEVSVNTEDFAGSQQVIADADNAIGVILNKDKPPTKMFISISKARDDESRRTIALDFDGRLGRVSDQEYSADQIKAVDKYLYNEKETEETLASEDALFDEIENKEKEELKTKGKKSKKTTSEEPKLSSSFENASKTTAKVETKVETKIETKVETKAETKVETKAETKAETIIEEDPFDSENLIG